MGVLSGKVAIITGAGGGIGRAHALLFAQEGAAVVVNDIGTSREGAGQSTSMADAVVAEIVAQGHQAIANYDSVAQREGVDNLLWTTLNKFKRVDILVNNAGIVRDRMVVNLSEADFDNVMAVHLRGTFLATQVIARHMKQQGTGGRIINTTSMAGLIGNIGQGNYGAAKAGIAGLTFICAQEFDRFAVTVNALAPIAVTRMTENLPFMQGINADAMGPQFVARAALFLASDLAASVSGKILGVEGNRLFEYQVRTTQGVTLGTEDAWDPAKIQARWSDICA